MYHNAQIDISGGVVTVSPIAHFSRPSIDSEKSAPRLFGIVESSGAEDAELTTFGVKLRGELSLPTMRGDLPRVQKAGRVRLRVLRDSHKPTYLASARAYCVEFLQMFTNRF